MMISNLFEQLKLTHLLTSHLLHEVFLPIYTNVLNLFMMASKKKKKLIYNFR